MYSCCRVINIIIIIVLFFILFYLLSSLSLSVLVMFFASLSDSFKYFRTADTFAALVHASIWSRHVIVRYNLFGLFAYSAEHRKMFFFAIFGRTISVAKHSVHP